MAQRIERFARFATEVFSPQALAFMMPFLINIRVTDSVLDGLRWGALAVLFVGVIPYGALRLLMLAGWVQGGHHVPDRRQRTVPIAIALVSTGFGIGLLHTLGAPRASVNFGIVTLTVVMIFGVVNLVWKLSGHAAIVTMCATVVLILFGPISLLASVPIALWTVWSRVRLRAHTLAQVLAGSVVGILVTAVLWAVLPTA